MKNAAAFGSRAAAYKKGRPGYPAALFDWIARQARNHDAVWDCATGSGQAALALAERFGHVYATDMSAEQIGEATPKPNITYRVSTAEASGLAAASVDAVTVATALHWFDFERFWPEVERVLRPGGFFAAWSYGLIEVQGPIRDRFTRPLAKLVQPFWSEGNAMAMAGYAHADVGFPFRQVPFPDIPYREEWTTERVVAFAESWSATIRARQEGLNDKIDALVMTTLAEFGGKRFEAELPLQGIAGRAA